MLCSPVMQYKRSLPVINQKCIAAFSITDVVKGTTNEKSLVSQSSLLFSSMERSRRSRRKADPSEQFHSKGNLDKHTIGY